MPFRKFGTSDDQRVLADESDKQGVQKQASRSFTEEDRRQLQKESADESRWDDDGGR